MRIMPILLLIFLCGLCFFLSPQKFKEYLNGSNLITKLQAKHDLLKQTLGEGKSQKSLSGHFSQDSVLNRSLDFFYNLICNTPHS